MARKFVSFSMPLSNERKARRKQVNRVIGQHIFRLDELWNTYRPADAQEWLAVVVGRLGAVATTVGEGHDEEVLDRRLAGLAAMLVKWMEQRC